MADHLDGVVQLLLAVFILHDPFAVAIAAHVDPGTGIAVAGKVGMRQRIARAGTVAFAVGQEFQNGRDLFAVVCGAPQTGRQTGAIRHDDGVVRVFGDVAGGVGCVAHGL